MKYDWEPDDLLNFDYDKPAPQEIIDFKNEEEMRRAAQQAAYLKYRQESAQQNKKLDAQRVREEAKLAKREAKAAKANAREIKSEKKAAKAPVAVANAAKSTSKFYRFTKKLSIPYVLMFAAFTIIMTIMNVLPFFIMVLLYAILGLLSLIIVIQLTKDNIKKWAKVVATTMAIVLMLFYGVGSAYALGTLGFLDKTSVKSDSAVSSITKEPFNVLITGIDVWGKISNQGRSDVSMVVTVNPKTDTILMTSIPRDYEVRLPDKGYATDKLTHTGFYGVQTSIGAIEDLLQMKINYYVKVNFSTVVKFIDAIGGLDFYNEEEFESTLTGHVYEKGMIHVQGQGALYYARERKQFLAGDNQRIINQQIIFSEMIKKATSSTTMLLSYNNVLSSLDKYFEMSFSSREIRSLLRFQLAKRPEWKMYRNTLTGGGASKGTYSTGSQAVYVTEPNYESVANAQALIQAVMNSQKLTHDDDGNVIIAPSSEEK